MKSSTLFSIFLTWFSAQVLAIGPFVILSVVLVLCDAYTGIQAARFRGEKIISRGLRRTITKIVMYFIAILSSRAIEIVFKLPEWAGICYAVSGLITYTEFKSNLENIGQYTQNDFWGAFVKRFPTLSNYSVDKKADEPKKETSN